jgi:hypothetical protein
MTYLRAFHYAQRNTERSHHLRFRKSRCSPLHPSPLQLPSMIKIMTALAVVMVATAMVINVILFETDKMLNCDARSGLRIADLTLSCLPSLALVSGSHKAKNACHAPRRSRLMTILLEYR